MQDFRLIKRPFIEVLSCYKSCHTWIKFYSRILLNVVTCTPISERKRVFLNYVFVYNWIWIMLVFFKYLTVIFTGKKTRRGVPTPSDMFLQVLELHPEILQQILSTVLNVIMFEDCRNQWSMSRPLLGLILLNEEVWYLKFHSVYLVNIRPACRNM